MTSLRDSVIRLLADGRGHSGEELGKILGVSRTAVWKHVQSLADLGLRIDAVAGQGYRLVSPLELLDSEQILEDLSPPNRKRIGRFECFSVLDSTNNLALSQTPPQPGASDICVAEFQSAGRGRRGRKWFAPYGSGVCLSASWSFDEQPPQLGALSLAAGVSCIEALCKLAVENVQLKWPNDLIWRGRKLGGILVEMTGEIGGPSRVVVGVGINWRLIHEDLKAFFSDAGFEPVDLNTIVGGDPPARNALVAALIDSLLNGLREFGEKGFDGFHDRWLALDGLAGQEIQVNTGNRTFVGYADGVDADGSLRVCIDGSVRCFASGETSLRVPT